MCRSGCSEDGKLARKGLDQQELVQVSKWMYRKLKAVAKSIAAIEMREYVEGGGNKDQKSSRINLK